MNGKKVERQALQARLIVENHEWLKQEASRLERSANWLLNRIVTEAREAAQEKNRAAA